MPRTASSHLEHVFCVRSSLSRHTVCGKDLTVRPLIMAHKTVSIAYLFFSILLGDGCESAAETALQSKLHNVEPALQSMWGLLVECLRMLEKILKKICCHYGERSDRRNCEMRAVIARLAAAHCRLRTPNLNSTRIAGDLD